MAEALQVIADDVLNLGQAGLIGGLHAQQQRFRLYVQLTGAHGN